MTDGTCWSWHVDSTIPLPPNPPPRPNFPSGTEKAGAQVTDPARIEASITAWNGLVRLLGSGTGYPALLQLEKRLADRAARLNGVLVRMLDRHDLGVIARKAAEAGGRRHGNDLAVLATLDGEDRGDQWHWNRESDDGSPAAVLYRSSEGPGGSNLVVRVRNEMTWCDLASSAARLLLDDDAFAESEYEADLAAYRLDLAQEVIRRYELTGSVFAFGETDSAEVSTATDSGSGKLREGHPLYSLRTATWADFEEQVDSGELDQLWLFVAAARRVLKDRSAIRSKSAVLNQVDQDLNDEIGVEWALGRARTYAKGVGAYSTTSKGSGGDDALDTSSGFKWLSDRVNELYRQGVDAGRPPTAT